MYTDYDYYLNVYGGQITDSELFDRLAYKASKKIDRVTFGRLKADGAAQYKNLDPDNWEAVNYATCEVIDKLYELERNGGKEVVSVSNDGYTETYAQSETGVEKLILSAAIESLPYWLIELDADWRRP